MTPQETDPDLPVSVQESLEVWVGSACYRVGGTEYSSACMEPFEGGCHYLHYTEREHSPTHQQKTGLKIY